MVKWRLEALGLLATAIAITGVVLNNGRVIWCFPLWIVSNGMALGLHLKARMWTLALRDAVFVGLAVAGWLQWSAG